MLMQKTFQSDLWITRTWSKPGSQIIKNNKKSLKDKNDLALQPQALGDGKVTGNDDTWDDSLRSTRSVKGQPRILQKCGHRSGSPIHATKPHSPSSNAETSGLYPQHSKDLLVDYFKGVSQYLNQMNA